MELSGKYFCGNEISKYGQENNYLDYQTMAKAFNHVLCNDITKLFYADINGEYSEPEQVSGFIDNSDKIENFENEIETLTELKEIIEKELEDETEEKEVEKLQNKIDVVEEKIEGLQDEIEELENEESDEVFQWYIVDDNGYEILKDAGEIVYFVPSINCYVWGVTHYGTSWDYVLTNVPCNCDNK